MYSSLLEPEAEKEIEAMSWCVEVHRAPMIMSFKERKKGGGSLECVNLLCTTHTSHPFLTISLFLPLHLAVPVPPLLPTPPSLTLQQRAEIELSASASAAAGAARVIVFSETGWGQRKGEGRKKADCRNKHRSSADRK